MWVARDKNGELHLFNIKPVRCDLWEDEECTEKLKIWVLPSRANPVRYGSYDSVHMVEVQSMYIDPSLFPEQTWEMEPTEVKLLKI